MKQLLKNVKAGFVIKSLLWSLLLYGCVTCMVNWNELTNKQDNQPVVYSNSDNSLTTMRVSIDSLRKQISTADYVLRYLYVVLK